MSDLQTDDLVGVLCPPVTVVTVCFNSVATLQDTLESVASQSLKGIEHIVVDGGSRDGTLKIIDRFRSGLAHVISEPDRGIYDAMNKGLVHATGDIVCFLNADDVYAHTDVLKKIAALMKSQQLDAVFGDVSFFNAKNPSHITRRYSSEYFEPGSIAYGWMPAHPSLFLRRSVYQRVGPFKTDYKIAGDFEFTARAFAKNELRYKYLPEVLVRMRAGGVSTAGWRSKILLNKEVLRACRENGIPTNIIKILSKYPLKLMEFWRR